uniref:Immunoglobulin C1-set domain-containing protein n=1 Tax=Hucho hucho TaxID=62062 RepID=A0A4W5PTD1_9TELE
YSKSRFCGYQFQGIVDCEYDDTIDNMIYFVKNIFNQKLTTIYESRVQKYVGFGEFGIHNASHYNSQAWKMAIRKAEVETICRYSARFFKLSTLERIVRLTKPSRHGELSMLEYSVLGFYPQEVRVTVTSTDTLANGDWSYQLHSYLEFRPQRRESVSCMVEHPSLDEPLEVVWGERPGEEREGGEDSWNGNVGPRGTERGKNILLIAVFL